MTGPDKQSESPGSVPDWLERKRRYNAKVTVRTCLKGCGCGWDKNAAVEKTDGEVACNGESKAVGEADGEAVGIEGPKAVDGVTETAAERPVVEPVQNLAITEPQSVTEIEVSTESPGAGLLVAEEPVPVVPRDIEDEKVSATDADETGLACKAILGKRVEGSASSSEHSVESSSASGGSKEVWFGRRKRLGLDNGVSKNRTSVGPAWRAGMLGQPQWANLNLAKPNDGPDGEAAVATGKPAEHDSSESEEVTGEVSGEESASPRRKATVRMSSGLSINRAKKVDIKLAKELEKEVVKPAVVLPVMAAQKVIAKKRKVDDESEPKLLRVEAQQAIQNAKDSARVPEEIHEFYRVYAAAKLEVIDDLKRLEAGTSWSWLTRDVITRFVNAANTLTVKYGQRDRDCLFNLGQKTTVINHLEGLATIDGELSELRTEQFEVSERVMVLLEHKVSKMRVERRQMESQHEIEKDALLKDVKVLRQKLASALALANPSSDEGFTVDLTEE